MSIKLKTLESFILDMQKEYLMLALMKMYPNAVSLTTEIAYGPALYYRAIDEFLRDGLILEHPEYEGMYALTEYGYNRVLFERL
jgi:hypothetical protein